MSAQLQPQLVDGPVVAPSVQAHGGHQPPQAFGLHCVAAGEHPPCRLKNGCVLLARGADCLGVCWADLTSR